MMTSPIHYKRVLHAHRQIVEELGLTLLVVYPQEAFYEKPFVKDFRK